MDLRNGAATRAEFEAAWDYQYDIGIEMDATVAERLFPCTADMSRVGNDCIGPRLPASLKISLLSDGVDASDRISRDTSSGGGSYWRDGTRETYIWRAAYVPLSPGHHYRMTVQSLVDGASVASAKPVLRIAVASSAAKGGWVYRALILFGALASLLIGVVWALISLIRRRRSR